MNTLNKPVFVILLLLVSVTIGAHADTAKYFGVNVDTIKVEDGVYLSMNQGKTMEEIIALKPDADLNDFLRTLHAAMSED